MVDVLLLLTLVLRRRFWARELVLMGRVGRRRRTQWIGLRRPDDLVFNGIKSGWHNRDSCLV
jgi:hypothetical protein